MPIVEVSKVQSDSDGDGGGAAEWEITVRRLPNTYSVSATRIPSASDVPADIREALRAWLATAK